MPLLLKQTSPLLGIWKIEESSDELLSRLRNREFYLPAFESIRTEHRRQEWLASRKLLEEIVGDFCRINYGISGAPFLEDSPLHISISHTKGYAALLVQEQPAAGIDIEYRSDRILKIRKRFMNSEEEAAIDMEHEVEHLLIHWCAKETLFKMIGQEDVDFCRHLHVYPFPFAEEGTFTVYETRTEQAARYDLSYRVTPEFVLTWSQPL